MPPKIFLKNVCVCVNTEPSMWCIQMSSVSVCMCDNSVKGSIVASAQLTPRLSISPQLYS